MMWKLAIAVSAMLLAAGYAVSEDWQKERAAEEKERQTELCHQVFDYNITKYHQTADVKYLRRLQFPTNDAEPCETFFKARL